MSEAEFFPGHCQMFQECIGARVRILSRAVTAIYDRRLRPLGLRVGQMNLLVVIATRGPLSAVQLSQQLCIEKSTVSRDLTRLVEQGWVQSQPGAGRTQLLSITTGGKKLIESSRGEWAAAQAEVETLLGKELVTELIKSIDGQRLSSAMNEES